MLDAQTTFRGQAGGLGLRVRSNLFPAACVAIAHQWRQITSVVLLRHDRSSPLQYILEPASEALTAMLLT